MEFDVFFSICQTEVDGYLPDERTMFANFFEQVELARPEERTLTVGFASRRFPFVNVPYGIVPRTPVEAAAWPVVKNKIFEEATEIFLRLLKGETLSCCGSPSARTTRTCRRSRAPSATPRPSFGRCGNAFTPRIV